MSNSTLEIPLLDLNRQYEPLYKELEDGVSAFLRSGKFILGPDLVQLEKELADYLQVKHTIGVSNGTDALLLSLVAAGVKRGDQVLTTPFTFFATVSSILGAGATPVFADIEADSFCLDPQAAEEALKKDTEKKIRAIVVVHLYGQPAKMAAFEALSKSFGVPLIEDAAQAIGATYKGKRAGGFGNLGSFSFYPSKNLGALGDAGLVTTNDSALYEKIKMLRVHGSREQYFHEIVGGNFRMDTLQALFLRKFLPHLDGWILKRQKLAMNYSTAFKSLPNGIVPPIPEPESTHCFHQYTIRVKDGRRDSLRNHLKEKGIASCVYYPVPCHQQNALAAHLPNGLSYPVSERASQEVLSLPIFPELSKTEQDRVIETIRKWATR